MGERDVGLGAPVQPAWTETYRQLTARSRDELGAADAERLAVAAYLIGEDDDSAAAWEAAHRLHAAAGAPADAARCSFWLALVLMLRGNSAQAGGWFGRTEQLVDESEPCAAAGYLLIPRVLGALEGGDPTGARDLAQRVTEIGQQFDDPDLRAFGTLGHGQALIALGDHVAGTARLDDVMVSVTAGEVGPVTSGIVYCAVILECIRLFDLARASEWTQALTAWCEAQPDLVPYRGQCLVHRSQLLQASGDWPTAVAMVESACQHLADPPHPALGLAYYQEGELHRLLGDFDAAEADYRQASRHGFQPMPGLALLDLARGDTDAAAAAIGRALLEVEHQLERAPLLAAAVDIMRSTGDIVRARTAADELVALTAGPASDVLRALAEQAHGTVLLGEGDPAAALTRLRDAATAWRQLHMPYETARTTVLLGLCCAALGDRSSATLEFDAARDTFAELGARPDLDRLEVLRSALGRTSDKREASEATPALSAREREVLKHVVAGKTNRQIAAELVISQHTVSRHLENTFAKLGVTSRAAATAYAFEHDLL